MNAIDILGSLLGSGSPAAQSGSPSSGTVGGKILGELIKAGMGGGGQAAPASSGSSTSGRSRSSAGGPVDINSESQRLEDLLGVATGKRGSATSAQRGPQPSPYQPAPSQPKYQPQSSSAAPRPQQAPAPTSRSSSNPAMTTNDEAVLLIRALVNAAKADGKLDQNEQQAILSRVPESPEAIEFIKRELAQPLDVRDFAWSVPLGMEVQILTMSLAAIDVDNQAEVDYLRELAHGLRLSSEVCNQVASRYGAPALF